MQGWPAIKFSGPAGSDFHQRNRTERIHDSFRATRAMSPNGAGDLNRTGQFVPWTALQTGF
ncbi:MAG: hypothetical protein CMJ81_04970 [Planctomycetaceae bacterium]|nr:hypothetical protein [Planctomycetaceae bacterium]